MKMLQDTENVPCRPASLEVLVSSSLSSSPIPPRSRSQTSPPIKPLTHPLLGHMSAAATAAPAASAASAAGRAVAPCGRLGGLGLGLGPGFGVWHAGGVVSATTHLDGGRSA